MQAAERPGEGMLAADGFLRSIAADGPVRALSPEGVGAVHVAVYASLTGAFDRHDSLVTAGREVLLVAAVVSALLLWRTARRLGLNDAAAATAVLLAGVPALLPPVALLDVPAALAVPWLLLAGFLTAPGRSTTTARIGAALAAAVAALLAPVVVLLVLSTGAAYAGLGRASRKVSPRTRTVAALLLAVAFLGIALLLRGWEPALATAAARGVPGGVATAGTVAFLAIGGLAGWRSPALRAPAIGLVATIAATLASALLIDVLFVGLPLAALLAGALAQDLLGSRPAQRRSGSRPAVVRAAAAVALLCACVAAVVSWPPAQARPTGEVPTALLSWAEDELPDGTRLLVPGRLRADLLHAGADEDQVLPPATRGRADPSAPVLTVSDREPPEGAPVLARFGRRGEGRPVVVVDPAAGVPTPQELQHRRSLAAAILANPRTSTGGRSAAVLRAAAVDQRLLSVLAAMTAQFGIGMADFPTAAAEPADGLLARRVLLDRAGGEALRPGATATDRLVTWLDAQQSPYAPDVVDVTGSGVLIGFRYASAPDALVSRSTP